jgi:hypothetical protein
MMVKNWKGAYRFCKLTKFPSSGGTVPENMLFSMLLKSWPNQMKLKIYLTNNNEMVREIEPEHTDILEW